MRYNSFRDPSRAASDGGLFDTELVLKPPPPYEPEPADEAAEEDALRLAPLRGEGEEAPPKRRRAPSRRALVLSAWALALTAALGLGYATQAGRQPIGNVDAPPGVAPAPDGLGEPVTAPPIASDPSRFTQAEAAPEVNPPTDDARPQVAQVAPEPAAPPAAAPSVATPAAPPITLAQADGADQVQKRTQATRTSALAPGEIDDSTPVRRAKAPDKPKAAKVESASADARKTETASADSRKAEKAPDTTKAADTKDLPQLKARMSRAYAQAVKAGTPRTVLKARQAEWAVLYAKAEKKGPAAVTALYRARAAQLEAIAKKSAKGQHTKA
jgi:hypothetical protein